MTILAANMYVSDTRKEKHRGQDPDMCIKTHSSHWEKSEVDLQSVQLHKAWQEQFLESDEVTGNTALFAKSHSARRHRSFDTLGRREHNDTGSI